MGIAWSRRKHQSAAEVFSAVCLRESGVKCAGSARDEMLAKQVADALWEMNVRPLVSGKRYTARRLKEGVTSSRSVRDLVHRDEARLAASGRWPANGADSSQSIAAAHDPDSEPEGGLCLEGNGANIVPGSVTPSRALESDIPTHFLGQRDRAPRSILPGTRQELVAARKHDKAMARPSMIMSERVAAALERAILPDGGVAALQPFRQDARTQHKVVATSTKKERFAAWLASKEGKDFQAARAARFAEADA